MPNPSEQQKELCPPTYVHGRQNNMIMKRTTTDETGVAKQCLRRSRQCVSKHDAGVATAWPRQLWVLFSLPTLEGYLAQTPCPSSRYPHHLYSRHPGRFTKVSVLLHNALHNFKLPNLTNYRGSTNPTVASLRSSEAARALASIGDKSGRIWDDLRM